MQMSFSELEYAAKKKVTRRDRFLGEIEAVVPWSARVAEMAPFHPRGKSCGRPPLGLHRLPRLCRAKPCFGFSDEGIEGAIDDSRAIRRFVGVDLAREAAPDATTLLNFRRLLEKHGLTERIFSTINAHLAEKGLLLKEGTIVDATIIAAPSSTKNRKGERDPEMHQTRKGNPWYFGMKARIGADMHSGVVHTLVTTPANVHDVTPAHALLHGEEKIALGDAGEQGIEKREEQQNGSVQWEVAMRPGKRRALPDTPVGCLRERIERLEASNRAKVEHPFEIVENLFGLKMVHDRGREKSAAQITTLSMLVSLWMARKYLLQPSMR